MDKVTVVTRWYNEELLAPLFFNHYGYCDEIRVLLDTDTDDRTRDIMRSYMLGKGVNISLWDVDSPNGMDNVQMLSDINKEISLVKEGWIYMVDADEFIFPEFHEDPRTFLARQTAEVVNCTYWHVYRHSTEEDIDYSLSPIPQRIHAQDGGPEFKHWFRKPSVFRAEAGIQLTIGSHRFQGEHTTSKERYIGAHWKQADYDICIRRRLSNMARHSPHDHKKGWGNHDFHVSAEKLRAQLDKNSNLPVLEHFIKVKPS